MEVDLAVLADAANVSGEGKLNLLGIFDNMTLGPDFPATSTTFSIVVRLVAHPSELGQHQLTLRVADADGKEVAKLDAGFNVGRKKASPKPASLPIVLGAQVTFPSPGDYAFDILIDGRWEKTIPLEVIKAAP
jgi:Family of unknown function (DUF6941)